MVIKTLLHVNYKWIVQLQQSVITFINLIELLYLINIVGVIVIVFEGNCMILERLPKSKIIQSN